MYQIGSKWIKLVQTWQKWSWKTCLNLFLKQSTGGLWVTFNLVEGKFSSVFRLYFHEKFLQFWYSSYSCFGPTYIYLVSSCSSFLIQNLKSCTALKNQTKCLVFSLLQLTSLVWKLSSRHLVFIFTQLQILNRGILKHSF